MDNLNDLYNLYNVKIVQNNNNEQFNSYKKYDHLFNNMQYGFLRHPFVQKLYSESNNEIAELAPEEMIINQEIHSSSLPISGTTINHYDLTQVIKNNLVCNQTFFTTTDEIPRADSKNQRSKRRNIWKN